MVMLFLLRPEARLDISKTFAKRDLRKGYTQILIEAGEGFCFVIFSIPIYTSTERWHRQVFYDLRKDEFACMHLKLPPVLGLAEEYRRF